MQDTDGNRSDDWELELRRALARRLPGLYGELFNASKKSVLILPSLSLKPWRSGWLAILRGERSDGGGCVVAFGAGDGPLEALRNVSAAAQKREFKRDQFARSISERTRDQSDKPEPLNVEGYSVGGDFQPPLPLAK